MSCVRLMRESNRVAARLVATLADVQTVTLRLRVFGLDVDVDVPAERAESIRSQWAWCLPDSPAQRDIAPLPGAPELNDEPLTVTRGADGESDDHIADYNLTTSITREAIGRRAAQFVMLHAGGVAEPETGRVAGLVAASGTGKTTATRHFCSRGYGYVSDESLIIGEARTVMPYPKPLSVVIDPSKPYEKTQHDPGEVGLAFPPAGPLTLGPLVVLVRERGEEASGDVARLEHIHLFDGLAQVLPQSSAMPEIPGSLDVLARLAQGGGGIHEMHYREIAETEHLLRRALALEPLEPFWRHVPGAWGDPSPYLPPEQFPLDPDRVAEGLEVERARFVDALVDDEVMEAIVLLGATPVRMSGLATLVWDASAGPRDLEQLTAQCVAELGDHPDATALVQETLVQMLADGVLRPVE
jgi:hypothetical protein